MQCNAPPRPPTLRHLWVWRRQITRTDHPLSVAADGNTDIAVLKDRMGAIARDHRRAGNSCRCHPFLGQPVGHPAPPTDYSTGRVLSPHARTCLSLFDNRLRSLLASCADLGLYPIGQRDGSTGKTL